MRRDVADIIAKLHPLERKVLPVLEKASSLHEIVSVSGMSEVEVVRALQWLQGKGALQVKEEIQELVELDENGKIYAEKGLPEKRFLKALEGGSATVAKVQENSGLDKDEITVCLGLLKRRNAIDMKKEKDGLVISLTDCGSALFKKHTEEEKFLQSVDVPRETGSLSESENKIYEDFQKRKAIIKTTIVKLKSVELTSVGKELLTHDLSTTFVEHVTQDMLKTGDWKNKKFRHYDVSVNVPALSGGKRHIVSQAITYIKQIWLDMGFVEMTGNMLQTSFWDLDSLYVPQDHPARQMQDTFFIKNGKEIALGKLPRDHSAVKDVHENGGKTGSTGWGTKWHAKDAQKVLLRTHTTVLSAQKLAELGKDPKTVMKKLPLKFFNVGRVFRNEALDWKHLFEFHQVDGIVIDPNANLKNLKAYLRQFFGKMGYPKIRMRPAYFPYTEPSLEVEVWHPKKQQWVELGGAGIFRPEVVVPLLGHDVPVLAWGLGLERIISEYWKLTDIRDLYKNDIKQLQEMKIWVK